VMLASSKISARSVPAKMIASTESRRIRVSAKRVRPSRSEFPPTPVDAS
jgi:hypothetical protein